MVWNGCWEFTGKGNTRPAVICRTMFCCSTRSRIGCGNAILRWTSSRSMRPESRRADAAIIFSMCQGRSSLENLAEWEREGAKIINSPQAALNTHRDRLPALMVDAGISFPETLVGRYQRKGRPGTSRSRWRNLAEARRCPRLRDRGCAVDRFARASRGRTSRFRATRNRVWRRCRRTGRGMR